MFSIQHQIDLTTTLQWPSIPIVGLKYAHRKWSSISSPEFGHHIVLQHKVYKIESRENVCQNKSYYNYHHVKGLPSPPHPSTIPPPNFLWKNISTSFTKYRLWENKTQMTPYNEVNIKMRCPQSRAGMNKKVVKLIPKPFNPILPKIEVKAEYNPQTKLLSADEKQKTSFIMTFCYLALCAVSLKLWKRKRIAAIESRNRKKEKFSQLENNLEWLKTENKKLQSENDLLREYMLLRTCNILILFNPCIKSWRHCSLRLFHYLVQFRCGFTVSWTNQFISTLLHYHKVLSYYRTDMNYYRNWI